MRILQALDLAKHAAHVCPWGPSYLLDVAKAAVLYQPGTACAGRRIAAYAYNNLFEGSRL